MGGMGILRLSMSVALSLLVEWLLHGWSQGPERVTSLNGKLCGSSMTARMEWRMFFFSPEKTSSICLVLITRGYVLRTR